MRELRLVMLGLAAVMLLLLAAGFVGRALHSAGARPQGRRRDAIPGRRSARGGGGGDRGCAGLHAFLRPAAARLPERLRDHRRLSRRGPAAGGRRAGRRRHDGRCRDRTASRPRRAGRKSERRRAGADLRVQPSRDEGTRRGQPGALRRLPVRCRRPGLFHLRGRFIARSSQMRPSPASMRSARAAASRSHAARRAMPTSSCSTRP